MSRRADRGLTLIEVIMALGLFAIVAALIASALLVGGRSEAEAWRNEVALAAMRSFVADLQNRANQPGGIDTIVPFCLNGVDGNVNNTGNPIELTNAGLDGPLNGNAQVVCTVYFNESDSGGGVIPADLGGPRDLNGDRDNQDVLAGNGGDHRIVPVTITLTWHETSGQGISVNTRTMNYLVAPTRGFQD